MNIRKAIKDNPLFSNRFRCTWCGRSIPENPPIHLDFRGCCSQEHLDKLRERQAECEKKGLCYKCKRPVFVNKKTGWKSCLCEEHQKELDDLQKIGDEAWKNPLGRF